PWVHQNGRLLHLHIDAQNLAVDVHRHGRQDVSPQAQARPHPGVAHGRVGGDDLGTHGASTHPVGQRQVFRQGGRVPVVQARRGRPVSTKQTHSRPPSSVSA